MTVTMMENKAITNGNERFFWKCGKVKIFKNEVNTSDLDSRRKWDQQVNFEEWFDHLHLYILSVVQNLKFKYTENYCGYIFTFVKCGLLY